MMHSADPRDVSAFALYLDLDLLAEAGAPDPIALAPKASGTGTPSWRCRHVRGLGSDIYGYGANAWWGPTAPG